MTGVWVTNDTISATRMNEKTIIQASGATINGLTTYAGMLAFCTASGSGFVADRYYVRNAANTSWSVVGVDQLPYLPLSTTIGDYTSPTSATASSDSGVPAPTFSDDFSGADAWVDQDSAKIGVNTVTDVLDFNFVADGTNDSCTYDLGAGAVNDTLWTLRFKFHSTTISDGTSLLFWIGLTDTAGTTDSNGVRDFMGAVFDYSGTNQHGAIDSNGAAVSGTPENPQSSPFTNGSDYWIEIQRTSATVYTVKVFDESTYTNQVGSTSTGASVAGTSGLRYIILMNFAAVGAGSWTGYIDDIKFYNNSLVLGTVGNVFDNNVGTVWTSNSEANPRVYVDLTSASEIVGIALNINKTLTTITSLKIRASTDTTFTDSENIAYVNISDFTDDTWRFLANNWLADNRRYVQIYANETGVLSINEIKVRYGVSDTLKILSHKHRTRPTSEADSFTDSN